MKKLLLSLALILAAGSSTYAQRMPPPEDQRKVQVAILFDTSGSMDGLIEQAKSRIWNIILEISNLKYNGTQPTLEIALYQYGNDGLSASDNYIQQLLDLSTDLDVLSQKLFALHTNGGNEYCGAVIGRSLDDLKWSTHPNDLRMIYIAGNEPFNQGPVDFKIECKKAADHDVFINTIYCGDYQQGIREGWQDGSSCTQGDYFNINSDEKIVQIATPYDDMITKYNDSLNTTYYGYGNEGIRKNSEQKEEDMNAASQSPSAAAERTIVKSKKGTYSNASWDLLDGVEKGEVDILKLGESELPEEFRGKTEAEKTALLEQKAAERKLYQEKIGQLAIDRESYIQAELKKRAEAGVEVDDFGTSVNKSINEKAEKIGFVKEAHN